MVGRPSVDGSCLGVNGGGGISENERLKRERKTTAATTTTVRDNGEMKEVEEMIARGRKVQSEMDKWNRFN